MIQKWIIWYFFLQLGLKISQFSIQRMQCIRFSRNQVRITSDKAMAWSNKKLYS